jgi:hypothetical protein
MKVFGNFGGNGGAYSCSWTIQAIALVRKPTPAVALFTCWDPGNWQRELADVPFNRRWNFNGNGLSSLVDGS